MSNNFQTSHESRLQKLTRKWWFYLLLLIIFFFPVYTAIPYNYQDHAIISKIIGDTLFAPLSDTYPQLFVLSKILMILLIIGIYFQSKKLAKLFTLYVIILYLFIALFQNSSTNTPHGLSIITGNIILMLIVASSWVYELFTNRTDFSNIKNNLGKNWWLIILALLAFWWPLNKATSSFEVSPLLFLTSEAMLTFCMLTPVVLSLLILSYPKVNLITLRLTSFIAILFGLINMVMWFSINSFPGGALHIPLLIISSYGFYLSFKLNKI